MHPLLLSLLLAASGAARPPRPRLVVVITVDQLRPTIWSATVAS